MIDYVKEDDGWKLCHVNFNPFFRTPYKKGWAEIPLSGTVIPTRVKRPKSMLQLVRKIDVNHLFTCLFLTIIALKVSSLLLYSS